MKQEAIILGRSTLENTWFTPADNEALASAGSSPIETKQSAFELMRRPELRLSGVEMLRPLGLPTDPAVREQLELAAIYEGYIQRQERLAAQTRRLDGLRIPADWNYMTTNGLSYETREKLSRIRPTTVGQAGRIPGVRPSDIALLIGHLRGVVGVA
jgi:tRNA uridine 5-carboxymethylaminomethyl modification enzyme